ncbi:hypothetical protein QRX50_23230 [Amycolatopsis carbonis]|uniref:Uncharacterized protein n=1 Tax=Amycolatopsis carbonis TaxID=715471 RepID=A0A9Y2IP13_9PSEU|nr:hypothetical protein [Amycolatopsis sp. 2-15]WIX83459.1 hypothetical protein QRX50_23230 [Amycolatopsis sp. 2-15]
MPNPGWPASAGHGPHLVVAGKGDDASPSDLLYGGFDSGSLPYDWRARQEGSSDDDLGKAQLIVCLSGLRKRGTTPIGTCEWDIARGDVYPATYTFEVYELKTGHELANFDVESDRPANQSCPSVVNVRLGQHSPNIAQGFEETPWLRTSRLSSPVTCPEPVTPGLAAAGRPSAAADDVAEGLSPGISLLDDVACGLLALVQSTENVTGRSRMCGSRTGAMVE